jgi:hypothetical protein
MRIATFQNFTVSELHHSLGALKLDGGEEILKFLKL